MIIQWPDRVLARLLPPGMEGMERASRHSDVRPLTPSKLRAQDDDEPVQNLVQKIVSSPLNSKNADDDAGEDLTLATTGSYSEDEDAASSPSNNENAEKDATAAAPRRRVHFADNMVQVKSIPRRDFPKTPPPRKKRTPKPATNDEAVLTPRRLSLRSASKLVQKNPVTQETKVEASPEQAEVPQMIVTPSKATTPRRRTAAKKKEATPSNVTPRRSSRRSSSIYKVSSEESSVATPESPARSANQEAAATPAKATKEQKLQALHLLSKLPKSAKRDLQTQLNRIPKHDKNVSAHLLTMVVDFKSAGPLLRLLSETPSLVGTVLSQLNAIFEG